MATDELAKRCMEAKGFKFFTVPPSQWPAGPENHQWGIDDVQTVRERGYGLSERQASDQDYVDPNVEYLASLSESERKAWDLAFSGPWEKRLTLRLPNGTEFSAPGEGCDAEADRKVYGDLRKYMELQVAVMQVAPDVDRRVSADPRYTDALAAWGQCMRDGGYRFEHSADAISAARTRYEAPDADVAEARAEEIRIAVADAECAVATGVVRIAEELERKFTTELLAEKEGHFIAWHEFEVGSVARAKRILGWD